MRFPAVLLVSLIIIVTLILLNLVLERKSASTKPTYGISFSPRYARYLNLDWKRVYIQILDDLKVRNLRIPTYWTSLEAEEGKYDFSETDFMLYEAEKRGAKVILAVGLRQPRWPECHIPDWAKNLELKKRQEKVLQIVQKIVERYKNIGAIWAYQVENEPFVTWFGENCDPPDKDFLQKEIQLVKKLDSRKPIIVTDSGEWSFWKDAMKSSDILGISVYTKAYNKLLGYITYPLPPSVYSLKANLVRKLFAPQNSKTIIAELQAEPWVQKAVPDTKVEEQARLFGLSDFQHNIDLAANTGFDQAYLWGVEWWYWMKEKGYPQYLEFAKNLF